MTIKEISEPITTKKDSTELLTYTDKKTGTKKRFQKYIVHFEGFDPECEVVAWSGDSPVVKWKNGDVVEVKMVQDDYGWKVSIPNKGDKVWLEIEAIIKRLDDLDGGGEIKVDDFSTPPPKPVDTVKAFTEEEKAAVADESPIDVSQIPF